MKKLSFKKLINNPKYLDNYLAEIEFEKYGNYKLVKEQPQYSDYGLTDEIINKNDKYKNKRKICVFILNIIVTYIIGLIISNYCQYTNKNIAQFYLSGLYMWICCLPLPIIIWHYINKINEIKTDIDIKLDNYNFDTGAYKYFQKTITKEKWLEMSGRDFEIAVANVFKKNNYNVELTQSSSDGGVDIILKDSNGIIKYVQCKAYKNKVGIAPVRELFGVMTDNNINYGMMVTLKGYTQGVYDFVKNKNIELLDLNDILKLNK